MKTMFFLLTIVFALTTAVGGIYVLYTGGQASAGFAAIPMLFTLAFLQAFRSRRRHEPRKPDQRS